MAKSLNKWLDEDINELMDKPINWLSEQYFFRDPERPVYSDNQYFFAPADGIVVYSHLVQGKQPIIDVKGKPYSLQEAVRDRDFKQDCLVIGIFMTFYDVHINRIPYPGNLSYKELGTIGSYNHPMLDVEKDLVSNTKPYTDNAHYLFHNQRILNRIYSIKLKQSYYILQIADYDVNTITPFNLKQNQPFYQNQRFSQIRYGSQVDLIIPLSDDYHFETLHEPGSHVEAGVDPVVKIISK